MTEKLLGADAQVAILLEAMIKEIFHNLQLMVNNLQAEFSKKPLTGEAPSGIGGQSSWTILKSAGMGSRK
jgi:hypothetical protein